MPAAARVIRVLAVTGGVLAMLFAGAILGGLIAFSIVWLVTVSERMSADATPNDRTIARLLLVIGAVVGFLIGGMLGHDSLDRVRVMTTSDPAATDPSPEAAAPDRGRAVFIAVLAIAFGLAAIVGAYIDWLWWPVYFGIVLTIAALPIVLIGAIAAALTHGLARSVSLVVLAVGVGLLAGQTWDLRPHLLWYAEGSMTVVFDGTFAATASGPADCQSVADGSEISVSGDPNLRLDTPDQPFLMISFDKGDRWEAIYPGPRANGIALEISVTDPRVPDDGKPSTIGMGADATSTVVADFNATGGVIRFADLVPLTGVDYSGEAMDLSGTIEFICDKPIE